MMNFKFLLRGSLITLLVWGCLGANVFGQSEINMNNRFQINKDGSYVTFGTTLANFPVIKGSLKAYQATLFYDPEKPEQTSATIRFGAEGLSTAHEKRDEQLHGPDFLDASSFPGIWFQGFETEVTEQGLNLKGDLYIKGVVQPVTVRLKQPTLMRKAMNNLDLLMVNGALAINRKDFDLGTSGRYAADPMLGEEVNIEFNFMCFSYTIDYLKALYLNEKEGVPNPVGLVYEEVKQNGQENGLKLARELSKDKRYKADNWATNLANIGWILMVDGYGKESLPFYDMALQMDKGHLPSLLRLGDAFTIAGAYDDALAHFEEEWALPARSRFTHIPHMIRAIDGSFSMSDLK
ncbi:MAG: YceI family protein [Cytophagales bacterium]|nr:YceI family protein [Cytophagales bacterium]